MHSRLKYAKSNWIFIFFSCGISVVSSPRSWPVKPVIRRKSGSCICFVAHFQIKFRYIKLNGRRKFSRNEWTERERETRKNEIICRSNGFESASAAAVAASNWRNVRKEMRKLRCIRRGAREKFNLSKWIRWLLLEWRRSDGINQNACDERDTERSDCGEKCDAMMTMEEMRNECALCSDKHAIIWCDTVEVEEYTKCH